ncbi:hypothetical protein A6V39_04410 [Candidatus Mycoplasma haematobovis]|uniref:Uncharacterized protein n=1 Tax=Candidatus Mycoplasma haematobovis TaxID=432608 RepID=A0A1A9QCD3_9MOLU|nr:hypothetical protein [Candidatus Mycoplasma haematobovis]OAL10127.1 hypothetical protein A6V39_04410 [Candidatus Mycoplasma haematobovis]
MSPSFTEKTDTYIKIWIPIGVAWFLFLFFLKWDPESTYKCMPILLGAYFASVVIVIIKGFNLVKDLINKVLMQEDLELRRLLVINRNLLIVITILDLLPLTIPLTLVPKIYFWRYHQKIKLMNN